MDKINVADAAKAIVHLHYMMDTLSIDEEFKYSWADEVAVSFKDQPWVKPLTDEIKKQVDQHLAEQKD